MRKMGIGLGVGINRSNYAQGIFNAYSARVVADGGVVESGTCVDAVSSLLQSASLLLIPSGYKGGKLYAEIPTNGNGDLTWTRGSDAFRTNASGVLQRVPWNLLQQSQTFDNATWIPSDVSVSANTTTAPDGTLTADKLVENSVNTAHNLVQAVSTNSGNYTFSIYAKASERNFIVLYNLTAVIAQCFDLSNGTIGASTGSPSSTITNVGNGWYRCTMTHIATTANNSFRIYLATSNTVSVAYQGNGTSGIFIWGAQLVEGTTAQTYLPTTDRLNFPRLSYMYGSCPALLLEPQRTNLALYSEQFDNLYWQGGGIMTSVTANTTTAPNGTTTADTAVVNATYNNASRAIVAGITNGTIYTLSVYVKKSASGGANNVRLSVNNSLSWTGASTQKVALTNDWQRVTLTWTSNASVQAYFIIGSVDNTGASDSTCYGNIDIWGAQMEVGSYPTTYIPTTGSATATRVADSFSLSNIYTNGLISASGGTWFVELRGNVIRTFTTENIGGGLELGNNAGTSTEAFKFRRGGGAQRVNIWKVESGISSILYTLITDDAKVAIKWNGTSADVFVNGTKVVSATSFTATTSLEFLRYIADQVPNFIQQMALFPTPLSDTDCQTLTTL